MRISEYKTIVFDCDGVILNSNKVKTEAFYKAALPYGEKNAKALEQYHVENGGVSRFVKFDYFLKEIVSKYDNESTEVSSLLKAFAGFVFKGLLECEIASGIGELKKNTPNSNWMVVSGGAQDELRNIFRIRNLMCYFNGGVFGSPDDKDTILNRELDKANIRKPAVFIGDSKLDYISASKAGLDFIFLTEWTEFKNWNDFFVDKDVRIENNLSSLVDF